MPYKDKALQRKTTLARVRRYRERQKGVTPELVCMADVTPSSAAEVKIAEIKREKERGHKRTDVTPVTPHQFSPAPKPLGAVRPAPRQRPLNASGEVAKRLSPSVASRRPRRHALKMGFEPKRPACEVDADGYIIPGD